MGYGTNKSGVISSDSTADINIPVNNNASHYNILLKTSDEFTQGIIYVKAYNSQNGYTENVYTNHGTLCRIRMNKPRHIVVAGDSLNGFVFTPSEMPAGLSYEILIENLGAWT